MRQTQTITAAAILCIAIHPAARMVHALSASSCAELGWNADLYGSPDVCGGSELANTVPVCDPAASFDEATALCAGAGARLCTFEELGNQETRGSGCGIDSDELWSSTPCDGGYLLEYGAANFQVELKTCAPPESLVRVRCCADVFAVQSPAPTVATTTAATSTPTAVTVADETVSPTSSPTPLATVAEEEATSTPSALPTPTPIPSPTGSPTAEVDAVIEVLTPSAAPTEPSVNEKGQGAFRRIWAWARGRNAASISLVAIGSVVVIGGTAVAYHQLSKKNGGVDDSLPTTTPDMEVAGMEQA